MKRIATQTIVLVRDGKRIVVKPKQSFDFTADEMKEITGMSKDALRKPVNEDDHLVEVKVPQSKLADVAAATATGGIVNADTATANPDASVPAPDGAATAPVTTTGKNAKPASKSAKDDDL